jgi:hypothetical protein
MEILGHSQIAVTMNIYAHVVQDTQREAVSHLDRMLKRRPVVIDRPVDVRCGCQRPPAMIGWGPFHWWARTVSNRRHLLCKPGTPISERFAQLIPPVRGRRHGVQAAAAATPD